jgi:hypothetical protein
MQSWGLRPEILDALLAGDAWAVREIQVHTWGRALRSVVTIHVGLLSVA